MSLKVIRVHCKQGGKTIRSYDFGYAETAVPSNLPDREAIIADAKNNLVQERIAFPPYDGIEFEVIYPRF